MTKIRKQKVFQKPYTLRRRFFNQQGQPRDWECFGTGEFTSIQDVQKQIRLLKANYSNRTVEVEFSMNGKLLDFNGMETGGTIIYKRRET